MIAALARVELTQELRRPGQWLAALLFAWVVMLLQSLALSSQMAGRADVACSVFFISAFFGMVLLESGRATREQASGVASALALAPASSSRIYAAKWLAALALILALDLCLLPPLILFYNLPLDGRSLAALAAVTALAQAALAALATLFSAASHACSDRIHLALPLMILPLSLPILALAALGSFAAFEGHSPAPFLKLLLAADIAFGGLGLAVYGRIAGRS